MTKLTEAVRETTKKLLLETRTSGDVSLNNALRYLAKWRSVLLQNTLIKNEGTVVQDGILAGLQFLSQSAEGCHIAKLLGTYEQPLQKPLKALLEENSYENLVNIGCAEGYYAVGLARLFPRILSYAYDTDQRAREACELLAQKNNVEGRIIINQMFTHQQFSVFEATNTLVFCDIEGAEKQLLDPLLAPSLASLDIVVESHECLVPGITQLLVNRFSESHEIIKIDDNGTRKLSKTPPWFHKLNHLDQLLCTWEWRSGPTPWLIMRAKR